MPSARLLWACQRRPLSGAGDACCSGCQTAPDGLSRAHLRRPGSPGPSPRRRTWASAGQSLSVQCWNAGSPQLTASSRGYATVTCGNSTFAGAPAASCATGHMFTLRAFETLPRRLPWPGSGARAGAARLRARRHVARATTKSDAVGSYRSALLYRSGTRLMGIILPYILYGKRTEDFFWRYGLRAYMMSLMSIR